MASNRPSSRQGRLDMAVRVSTESSATINRLNAEPARSPPRVPPPIASDGGDVESGPAPALAEEELQQEGGGGGEDQPAGSRPSSATPESRPASATPGSRPASATPGSRPASATPGSLPASATPGPPRSSLEKRTVSILSGESSRVFKAKTKEEVNDASEHEEHLSKGHTLPEACLHCWSQPAIVILYLLFLGIFLTSSLYAKADIAAADHDCGVCMADDGCHPTIYEPQFRMVNHSSYYSYAGRKMASAEGDALTGLEIPGDLFISYACDGEYIMTCMANEGDDDYALYDATNSASGDAAHRRLLGTTASHHYWTTLTCDVDGDTAAHRRRLDEAGSPKAGARSAAALASVKPAKPGLLGYWPNAGYSFPLWRSMAESSSSVAGENQCPHELDWGNSVTTVTFALACILFLTFAIEHLTELVHETVRFFREPWVMEVIGTLLKELCLLGIGSITVSIINEASLIYDLTAEQYHILHLVHNGVFIFAVCYITLAVLLMFLSTKWINYVGDQVDKESSQGVAPPAFEAASASLTHGPWSTDVVRAMEYSFAMDLGLTEEFDFVKYAEYFAQESCAELVELKEAAWIVFLGFLLVNLVRYKTVSLPTSTMVVVMGSFQVIVFLMLVWILYDARLGTMEHLHFRSLARKRRQEVDEEKIQVASAAGSERSSLSAMDRFKKAVKVVQIAGRLGQSKIATEVANEASRVNVENDSHHYSAQVIERPGMVYHLLQLAIFYSVLMTMGAVYYSFYATDGASIAFLVLVWAFILLIMTFIVLDWSSLVLINSMVEINHEALEHVIVKTYHPDPEQSVENREMAHRIVTAVEKFCSDTSVRVSVDHPHELDSIIAKNMPKEDDGGGGAHH